jgi:hypothetical protein
MLLLLSEMFESKKWWLILVVAVVAAVCAFIMFGTHFITQLIDDKIGNIKVNVPKIKVTPPQVVVQVCKDEQGKIVVKSENKSLSDKLQQTIFSDKQQQTTLSHKNRIQTAEPFLAVVFDDLKPPTVPIVDNPADVLSSELGTAPIVVDTSEPATSARVVVGCRTDADCNVVNGNGNNVCKSDGTCNCIGGGSGLFCHYGPTNYRDPKDMQPDELRRFKSKFRNNYTLQDYKNWLLLYKKDPENLREQHRRNLRMLLQGSNLSAKDMPSIRLRPPTNASDYFQQLYQGGNIAVHFPDEDSPYVGANFGDYGDFVPPQNIANTWVTGIVNAYKDGKDDARALDWYMLPETTTGEDEQRVGEIYQRYVQRQHNLADARIIAGSWQKGQVCDEDVVTTGYKDLQTFRDEKETSSLV